MKKGTKSVIRIEFESRSWAGTLVLSFLLLGSGMLIYMYLRPGEAKFLQWLPEFIAGTERPSTAQQSSILSRILPSWFIFSLPAGLWAMAYAIIIIRIWRGQNSRLRILWYLSIPVLVFGFEFCQLWGIVPGTFCYQDLIAGLLGLLLGSIISIKRLKIRKINLT